MVAKCSGSKVEQKSVVVVSRLTVRDEGSVSRWRWEMSLGYRVVGWEMGWWWALVEVEQRRSVFLALRDPSSDAGLVSRLTTRLSEDVLRCCCC
jgi:hypothetical protein